MYILDVPVGPRADLEGDVPYICIYICTYMYIVDVPVGPRADLEGDIHVHIHMHMHVHSRRPRWAAGRPRGRSR